MSDNFVIKRGDRLPVLERTLTLRRNGVSAPIDLTGCTVQWTMRNKATGATKVSAAATIVSAVDGMVEYAWGATDTDTEGQFLGEWRVTYPDTKALTVPTIDFLNVTVARSLS